MKGVIFFLLFLCVYSLGRAEEGEQKEETVKEETTEKEKEITLDEMEVSAQAKEEERIEGLKEEEQEGKEEEREEDKMEMYYEEVEAETMEEVEKKEENMEDLYEQIDSYLPDSVDTDLRAWGGKGTGRGKAKAPGSRPFGRMSNKASTGGQQNVEFLAWDNLVPCASLPGSYSSNAKIATVDGKCVLTTFLISQNGVYKIIVNIWGSSSGPRDEGSAAKITSWHRNDELFCGQTVLIAGLNNADCKISPKTAALHKMQSKCLKDSSRDINDIVQDCNNPQEYQSDDTTCVIYWTETGEASSSGLREFVSTNGECGWSESLIDAAIDISFGYVNFTAPENWDANSLQFVHVFFSDF